MKRILTLALCAVLMLGATVLLAQPGFHHRGGPGKGGHADFLARALDLTDEQKAAAKEIHEEAEAKAETTREQHREQMEEIRAFLDGTNPDATQIGQKMIAAHATRQQLKALHQEAMTKLSALLNAEQLEKFKGFQEKLQERHHGPEGFGHRGPGF